MVPPKIRLTGYPRPVVETCSPTCIHLGRGMARYPTHHECRQPVSEDHRRFMRHPSALMQGCTALSYAKIGSAPWNHG